jgi:hypothetical protein
MKPSDYLPFYAGRFRTVEIDSAFYVCPTARTVENWNARFVFSDRVNNLAKRLLVLQCFLFDPFKDSTRLK